jgi:hypothetical protein
MRGPAVKRFARHTLAIAGSAALLLSCVANADQAAEDRLRDQLRQTTLQLRAALDDNADLKAKVDTLTQQLAAQAAAPPKKTGDGETAGLRRKLDAQQQESAEMQRSLDQARQSLAQSQKNYEDALALAKSRDAEAKRLEAQLQDSDGHAKTYAADNAKLVKISQELLDRYKHKGVWSAVKNEEPVTGLTRIELEKLAQDYHAQIVDSTVPAAADTAAPASAAH